MAAHHTVSSLAAAEAVLNRQQKEAGTLLLDIGAGTTNMVVVEDGEVQHVAVIPMGGIHITNDLAIGLKTELEIAEKVKVGHANLLGSKTKTITVQQAGRTHSFDSQEVLMITEARVEELLEFVEKELKAIHKSRKLPGGVVIVGGSAKLPGIVEFTKEKLQLPARLGSLQAVTGLVDTVQDISYTSAIGLMLLDMLLSQHQYQHKGQANDDFSLFGLITNFIKRTRK
jgi:cell division protein FtsA